MSNKLTMLSVHLADLQRSGLIDETIQAAGIYTVTPGEIGKKLGGNDGSIISMLAFPYPDGEPFERFKCLYENAGARVGNKFYIRGLMKRSRSAQEPTVCCPRGTDHVGIRALRLQLPIDL